MKAVLAIDSFKGTLSSEEVENVLARALEKVGVECVKIPIADGGEGLVASLATVLRGEKIKVRVTDPNGEKTNAEYLMCGEMAIIETAAAAGLPMSKKSAADTTTYGVGEMMLDAENRGAREFILGLGGSATNDGGTGMAAALGCKFYDANGNEFIPVGRTLKDIKNITLGEKRKIKALCDVKNPLFGKTGAAYVFAPQKGASEEEVVMLDEGLKHLYDLCVSLGLGDKNVEGAGAAGGLGFGVLAFEDGTLRRGIDAVLDIVGFDEALGGADIVITGEGRLDTQSFGGKVIDGVIARAGAARVLAVVGTSLVDGRKYGIEKVFETNPDKRPFEEVKKTAKTDLEKCAEIVAAYIKEE